MAAPVWLKRQSSANSGLAGTFTPTLPTSITAGNLLVMAILAYHGSIVSVDTPSGWTAGPASAGMGFSNLCKGYVFYKLAGSSETAPNLTGTFQNIHVEISEISGAHPTTPVSASAAGTVTSGATIPTPASTAADADSLAVFLAYENNTTASYTGLPSSSTSRYNEAAGGGISFAQVWADKAVGAGAIAANSFTRSATTYTGVAHTLVIKPAPPATTVSRFKRLKLGTGITGTDLGGGVMQLDIGYVDYAALKAGVATYGDLLA